MWAVSDSIKRKLRWNYLSQSFGTIVQISRICKEDPFSHQNVVPGHMA